MNSAPLNDSSKFELISGLWKGDRGPLKSAKVLRSTNFGGDGLLDFGDVAELNVEARLFADRQLKQDDIIIERSGGGPKQPVGRVAQFVPPDDYAYFSSNFTTALRIRNRKLFNPEYVALYLHALYLDGATETLQRATTGIRNLDWREYLRFEVPLLSLKEQEYLAQLIGGVRSAQRNEQALVDVFKSLKRSALSHLFTRGLLGKPQKETTLGEAPTNWIECSIARLGEVVTGTTPPTREPAYYVGGDIPFISPGDIEHGARVERTQKVITQAGLAVSRALPAGSTCVVCIGSTIGKVGRTTAPSSATNQQINAIIPGAEFDAHYVSQLLTYWSPQVKNASSPSPVPILSKGAFERVNVVTSLDLDEQRAIAAILKAIDRKIDLHQQKRVVLEDLFKALLHKLMTGELAVDDLDLSALARAAVTAEEADV